MKHSTIPNGWVVSPLDEMVSLRGERVSPADYPDADFIGMDHVESHSTKIIKTVVAGTLKSSASRFHSGDVLYGRLRPYLNKVTRPPFDGLASAEFMVFPPNELVTGAFLKYRLNAADFVSFASHLNEGDRPRVSFDQIGKFELLLPPPAEQHRIVAKVEELFSELDNGGESLTTAREQLKVYRQALLKYAFEGKLTTQWREENNDKLESADQIIAQAMNHRNSSYRQRVEDWEALFSDWRANAIHGSKPSKPKPLKPFVDFSVKERGQLTPLPFGWAWLKIVSLFDVVSGGTPKGVEEVTGHDIPFYKISDMTKAGNETHMHSAALTMSEEERDNLGLTAYSAGTIIFPKRGGAILTNKKRILSVASCFDLNTMGIVNSQESVSSEYLWWWFQRIDLAKIYDGSNVPQINNKNVEPIAFPLCSIEEQHQIVKIVAAQMSVIDELEADIERQLRKSRALRQSILKKAFAGQLVAQDPNDEPVSVLLERVKAEKETNNRKSGRKAAA